MDTLRKEDMIQIAEHGLTADEVRRQLRLLASPPPKLQLRRPCTVGDGVRRLSDAELDAVLPAYEAARRTGRLMKFVPASGAATRMFQSLLAVRDAGVRTRDDLLGRAARGNRASEDVLALLATLTEYPFFAALQAAIAAAGGDLAALMAAGQVAEILDCIVGPRGLGYAALPKGLLAFHRYADGSRTAFEEHLVEAAATVRDAAGICRVHFTVSPEHEERFRQLFDRVRATYQRRHDTRFDVSFSAQKSCTDTVAVGADGTLLREADDRIVFRPGGHGALIENLNDLRADIVLAKNIDNVQPDGMKETTVRWKRALAGVLASVQDQLWAHVRRLRHDDTVVALEAAERFARETLELDVTAGSPAGDADLRTHLLALLDRPIRVCGVVRNTGEPGGGPFWVRARDGTCTRQIVEQAEVDPQSTEQQALLKASTHFNPVDLACGVRDDRGEPFDLRRFVDEDAVFITRKSKDGRELRALERPGLWNGGMAHWITLFVEVPITTFTPVKTVLDLVRPEHRGVAG